MKKFTYLFLLLHSICCFSQKTANLCGEYKYAVPDNIPLNEAKKIATERARLDAIAKEFGTSISQTNLSSTHTKDGETQSDFLSMGGTEVNGTWLGDKNSPEIYIDYEQDMLVVHAKVCGTAREITRAQTDLATKILCNEVESERFNNNNRIALQFRSPIDGYLAIFLRNDYTDIVSCLLPYETENGKARSIDRNKTHHLLSTKDPLYPYREETILVTDRDIEFNTIIFVFSEKEFSMPNTENGEYLPELSVEAFTKWLRRNRIKDEHMQVIEKNIEIRKK